MRFVNYFIELFRILLLAQVNNSRKSIWIVTPIGHLEIMSLDFWFFIKKLFVEWMYKILFISL